MYVKLTFQQIINLIMSTKPMHLKKLNLLISIKTEKYIYAKINHRFTDYFYKTVNLSLKFLFLFRTHNLRQREN